MWTGSPKKVRSYPHFFNEVISRRLGSVLKNFVKTTVLWMKLDQISVTWSPECSGPVLVVINAGATLNWFRVNNPGLSFQHIFFHNLKEEIYIYYFFLFHWASVRKVAVAQWKGIWHKMWAPSQWQPLQKGAAGRKTTTKQQLGMDWKHQCTEEPVLVIPTINSKLRSYFPLKTEEMWADVKNLKQDFSSSKKDDKWW